MYYYLLKKIELRT